MLPKRLKSWTGGFVAGIGIAVGCAMAQQPGLETDAVHPDRPGLIIIESAFDPAAAYRWTDLPSLDLRCLVWQDGILTIPATVSTDRFGVADLTVPYGAELIGISEGQRLLFREGRYMINQPLLLTDGRMSLFLARGDILIEDGRVVYRTNARAGGGRAQYLLLSGIVLLIVVLMIRARSRLRNS